METFDPYHKWLGIPSKEQPPNHYRLLGIDLFESDPDVIETAADRQMTYVAKCANGPHQKLSQKILNELSAARVCLLSSAKRQAYDLELRKLQYKPEQISEPQEDAEFQFSSHEFTTQESAPQEIVPHEFAPQEFVAQEFTPDQFTPQQFDANPPRPARPTRTTNHKKQQQSTSLLMMSAVGAAVSVAAVLVAWQFTQKPVTKPSATAAKTDSPRNKPPSREAVNRDAATDSAKKTAVNLNAAQANQSAPPAIADSGAPQVALTDDQNMTSSAVSDEASMPGETAAASSTTRLDDALSLSPNGPDKLGTITGNDKKIALAQPPKPKSGTSKKPNPKGIDAAENELPNVAFSPATWDDDESTGDPDESPDGKIRLAELLKRASEANAECVKLDRECRPLLAERQVLIAEIAPRQVVMLQAESNMKQFDAKLALLKDRPRFNTVGDPLNAEQDKLQENRNHWSNLFETNKNEITNRVSRIEAVDASLQGMGEHLKKRWNELNDYRKQWMALCRPQNKYARADFEGTLRVIEDWIQVDELWSDALCWAALVAYDLDEPQRAAGFVEAAEKLRAGVVATRRTWPQIEALQGLIALTVSGQRSKSPSMIQKAIGHVDKDIDWQTHFVAGRAAEEIGRMDGKAKAYFERALKIDPTCQHAAYRLGRLQTTSSDKSVRDVDAGTKLLESVWSRTGKQSWRIGFALVQAYDAAERTADASQLWETTLELAPTGQHEQLKKQRNK